MLCQNCGKNNANVKYTQVINGEKTQMYLCEDCAHEMNIGTDFNFNFDFDHLFSSLFSPFETVAALPETEVLKCPVCGMTYEDFAKLGKFGCAKCYQTFGKRLDTVLKKLHGNNRHIGRGDTKVQKIRGEGKTKSGTGEQSKEDKIKKLKEELEECIRKEEYEKAAVIRDEIKKIEKQLEDRER